MQLDLSWFMTDTALEDVAVQLEQFINDPMSPASPVRIAKRKLQTVEKEMKIRGLLKN